MAFYLSPDLLQEKQLERNSKPSSSNTTNKTENRPCSKRLARESQVCRIEWAFVALDDVFAQNGMHEVMETEDPRPSLLSLSLSLSESESDSKSVFTSIHASGCIML